MGSKGAGITPKDLTDARSAALGFLQAVTKGDEGAASALLIVQEGEKMDFKTMGESIETFELGEAKAEGAQVVVVAAVKAKPGQDGPPALPLVLLPVKGAWKVDMSASITRMMGVSPEEMMNQLAEGLGNALAQGMNAMAEGLSQGMSAAFGEGNAVVDAKPSAKKRKPQAAKKGAKAKSRK